jgi:hypothetical protein
MTKKITKNHEKTQKITKNDQKIKKKNKKKLYTLLYT